MKQIYLISLSVIFAIILMPLIMAETGCCYDSQQGICSLNADKNNCIDGGGNWSDDATCNAESRCTKGCCIAGNVIAFTTDRRCEVLSSSYGVVKNFNSGMTESQCYSQSQTGIDGACVFGEDNECTITSSGNCSGTFHQGVSCTDVDTICEITSNTTCYKEDVYSVDSCGNPDHKLSDCNYASGTICKKEGNTAFCKSLNCGGGKVNGQSWCVSLNGEGYVNPLTVEDNPNTQFEDWSPELNPPQNKSLKMMSYNIAGGAGLYEDPTSQMKKLAQFIKNNQIDIAGLQEAETDHAGKNMLQILFNELNTLGYPMQMKFSGTGNGNGAEGSYGDAILSRYPIENYNVIKIADRIFQVDDSQWAKNGYFLQTFKITFKGEKIRFFNVHATAYGQNIDPYYLNIVNQYLGETSFQFGDFNAHRDSPAIVKLMQNYNDSCTNDASCLDSVDFSVRTDLQRGTDDAIDFIFYRFNNANWRIINAFIDTNANQNLVISDHFPVIAEFDRNSTNPNNLGLSGNTVKITGNVIDEGEEEGSEISAESAPVGSRYFRQYCLNGEIFTEPCSDFRAETCVAGESVTAVAKCELNDWNACLNAGNDSTACGELEQCKMWTPDGGDCVITGSGNIYCGFGNSFYKMNGTRDSMTKGEEVTEADIVMDVDSSGGEHFTGRDNTAGAKLIDDLNLAICVPKIAGGLEFYPTEATSSSSDSSKETSSATETCGKGNYESIINWEEDYGCYFYIENEDQDNTYWGNLGLLINASNDSWVHNTIFDNYNQLQNNYNFKSYFPTGDTSVISRNLFCDKFWRVYKKLPVEPKIVDLLTQRCQAMADCEGKVNWIGVPGAEVSNGIYSNSTGNETNETQFFATRTTKKGYMENGNYRTKFLFNFTCAPYKAPVGASDCEKCGSDGLACSEYRCKSLGQKCEYYEPEGVQTGICQNSEDNEPPQITLSMSPSSPVLPNTAVNIFLSTNERAECKFDVGVAGTSFEGMNYNFAGIYTLAHNVTLNVPGQDGYNSSESYDLINHDGDYYVYARCMDAVGNWNIAPSLISFEVMETPDLIAPIISNFNPVSGSRITYGQTSKTISFKINEPAECKWSSSDVDFVDMEKNFSCDTEVSDSGMINGYGCTGTMTDITLNATEQTKFYIKCKDQPWLEGNENELYQRNTNDISTEYILRASLPLQIKSITPRGEIKVSPLNRTIIIRVNTSDGSNNGISECYWKEPSSETWIKFSNTGSSNKHSQIISNPDEGENIFDIGCRDLDSNGNEINRVINQSIFNVISTSLPPSIIMIYRNNQTGDLTVITEEPSECRYTTNSTIGCSFVFSSGNIMTTTNSIKHSATYEYGDYYIKCRNERGFADTDTCGVVIRT